MSSVSAYNPPLRGRMVWKDPDSPDVRSSNVDIVAVMLDAPSHDSATGVIFIGSTRDPDRRTVWAWAEDTTFEQVENYLPEWQQARALRGR